MNNAEAHRHYGDLRSWQGFLLSQAHILSLEPDLIWQQGANMPDDHPVAQRAMEMESVGLRPKRPWIRWLNKSGSRGANLILTIKSGVLMGKRLLVADSGRFIVVHGSKDNRTIHVFHGDTGQEIPAPPALQEEIAWVGVCPASGELVWSPKLGSVFSGSLRAGSVIRIIRKTSRPLHFARCSFAGHVLAWFKEELLPQWWQANGEDWPVRFDGIAGWHSVPNAAVAPSRIALCFTAGGEKEKHTGIAVIDEASGETVATIAANPSGLPFEISRDGNHLFVGKWDGRIEVWRIPDKKRFLLSGHRSHFTMDPAGLEEDRRYHEGRGDHFQVSQLDHARIVALTGDPLGRILASASDKGEIKIWSVESGELLAGFYAHEVQIQGLCFFPDGRRLASLGGTGDVKVWRVPAEFLGVKP
jgi:WD40 repeat protein